MKAGIEPTGGTDVPDMPELTDDACERLVHTCMRAYFRAEWGVDIGAGEGEAEGEAWDEGNWEEEDEPVWDDEGDLEAGGVEGEMEEPPGWED
jgi:hypothetical protein